MAACLAVLSTPGHAQGIVAGHIVNGDSYFAFTSFQATCNDGSLSGLPDGTVNVTSEADVVNLSGDIQTIDRNDAEDGGAGETTNVSNELDYTGIWTGNALYQLEPDDTGFVTYRGRDGSTVSDDLIYEVTARFDCSGAAQDEPAVVTFESFHRNPPAASPGIAVDPTSGLTTSEAGATAAFAVVLESQPAADVLVGLSSSDASEGTVAPASLTFTAANWDTPQSVTVTGVSDDLDDGDVAYLIQGAATSSDPAYDGLASADVSVTNTDVPVEAVDDPEQAAAPIPVNGVWSLVLLAVLLGGLGRAHQRRSTL
jgi:hypothetical protein